MDTEINARRKIKLAEEILYRLSQINVEGVSKLQNKIKQEINFLEKCIKSNIIKEEHLVCLNLTHLEAIASKLIELEENCLAVMCNKTLTYESGFSRKICIDLVLFGGSVWMKVIARNQKAITLVSNGEGSYNQKSVLHQAEEFVECSKQNLCFYKPPKIIFFFANGVDNCVTKDLLKIGVVVEKNENTDCNYFKIDYAKNDHNINEYPIKDLKIVRNIEVIRQMPHMKLNLGVTTLIAYVSALTNGGCNYNFKSDILQKHAEWEKSRPVKPILDSLFEGRELYCCSTAAKIFKNILGTLGGKTERERGEKFLEKLIVVEDRPSNKLKLMGKVKKRSLAIFGTGEYLQAVTVTANHAFVRAAMNQGIHFSVFLHESRALTEEKQLPL